MALRVAETPTVFWSCLRTGRFQTPHILGDADYEWLWVQTHGYKQDVLEIICAGKAPGAPPSGPPQTVDLTFCLVAQLLRAERREATFLFLRDQPPGLALTGLFFPAEGTVRLKRGGTETRIFANGRHRHARKSFLSGAEVPTFRDTGPDAALAPSDGLSWQFDALALPSFQPPPSTLLAAKHRPRPQ